MKPITLVAALLVAAPASAQSFFPSLYGGRFCELRRMGIDVEEARKVAMTEAWSRYRQVTYVTFQGKVYSLDVLDGARYIVDNCPELAK